MIPEVDISSHDRNQRITQLINVLRFTNLNFFNDTTSKMDKICFFFILKLKHVSCLLLLQEHTWSRSVGNFRERREFERMLEYRKITDVQIKAVSL